MITATIKAQHLDNFMDIFISIKSSAYLGDFDKYLEVLKTCDYYPQNEALKFFNMYTSYHKLHNEMLPENFTIPLDVYYYMINTSIL